MSDRPYFSVVIPTYNRAHLVVKTLESVFNQTFHDFEVIVVDNGSTDKTEEVLRPFAQAGRIEFIRHETNLERAAARNTGMKVARGKFVTLLDSDDIMYAHNLQAAYSFAERNPGCDIFHNLYELINENGKPIYQYRFPSLGNQVKAIANGNFLSCIGVFISEAVYRVFRFDTQDVLQGFEDWEYWMRILPSYKLGRIDQINSGIVHHGGRSMIGFALGSYEVKMEYIRNKICQDPVLRKVYEPYLKTFTASCYLLAASMANSSDQFVESKRLLSLARRANPAVVFTLRYIRIAQKAFFRIKDRL